ncbi:MAG: hypothetical protein A2754_01210 [Candidatus Magasanikbacteria bacterium RIFCSPHIGHO2_01_FULL_47_8]|uniref:Uncharacterized protein n=1 Tax=Candidatus Magasanikbacteria bacterium RIFCSPHIGHO2_01_FULL_47_8 TaxID=1798673 RepID=A0A1F6MCM4_9BACT|nr:MAG: hypothetical protein A2754_01210 [Candidatus Magasanikbacteria bacterium RIFCSPHIGHO2_01_FULL_47_8]
MGWKLYRPAGERERLAKEREQQERYQEKLYFGYFLLWGAVSVAVGAIGCYCYIHMPSWSFALSRLIWGIVGFLGTASSLVWLLCLYLSSTETKAPQPPSDPSPG